MRARNTLLLLGIFAVLLIYVVRVELEKPSEATQRAERLQMLTMQPGFVTRLTIETHDHRLQLGRDDSGRWYVTEPYVDRADDTRVFGLLDELTPLASVSAVSGNRAERITYRFDRPAVVVTLQRPTGIGFATRTLRVGRKNPAFDAYYAIVDDDTTKTGLIPSRLVEQYLMKEPQTYRNMRITDVEVQDPKLLSITTPTSRVIIERDLGTRLWHIVSPIEAGADQPTVNDLVRRLGTQRIESFVDEQPEDLARYGLDRPSMSITVVLENELRETIHLGAPVADGSGDVYARRERRPTVFTLPESGRIELMRTLFELREKKLMDVSPASVRRFTVAGADGAALAIERDDEGWVDKTDGNARRLRRVPVEQVIQNLTVVEARAFGDRPEPDLSRAFDAPLAEATLGLASGDSVRIAFARFEGSAYARVGTSGTIARVDDDDPDLLLGILRTPPWVR